MARFVKRGEGMKDETRGGQLIIVPTPIGNREDITLRALRLLEECDAIACEDTRHSGPLLQGYGISKPLFSYHDHNEQGRAEEIVRRVAAGERICLISDAGMPGISDPGQVVIDKALSAGLSVTVLPGPSASVTVAAASGLVGKEGFVFLGFLPRKGKSREALLSRLDRLDLPAIIYESPLRVRKSLAELCQRWPERTFAVCREWTKQYEEILRFQGRDYQGEAITEKGEFAIVLGPAAPVDSRWSEGEAARAMAEAMAEGASRKQAAEALSQVSGWSKNELYQLNL